MTKVVILTVLGKAFSVGLDFKQCPLFNMMNVWTKLVNQYLFILHSSNFNKVAQKFSQVKSSSANRSSKSLFRRRD